MMRRGDLWRAAAARILPLALFCCASGPAPIDHFYRLDPGSPRTRAATPLDGTLQVERLLADAITGERHILYRKNGATSRIDKHSYHRWSDPPAIAIQTEMVSYLQNGGAAQVVMAATARVVPDFVVFGRLQHFERVLGSQIQVVVEMDLTLTNTRREILLHESYREERPAADASIGASVEAFGANLGAILERFLADLPSS